MNPICLLIVGALLFFTSITFAADWRAVANERIEKIRKGDLTLSVRGADGRPLADTPFRIEQIRSRFHFGVCVTGDPDSPNANEQKYFQFIKDHFNTVVSENEMKWYSTEKQRDVMTFEKGDRFVKWAHDNGLAARGHTLFWSKPKFVQKWVQELPDDELRQEVKQYIDLIVPRYKGRLIAWDVNNEMLDGSFYKDRLGDGIRAHFFKRTAELDPQTPLFVNEYSIFGNEAKTGRYIELIRQLQKQGAPIGGIGIQEHACERIVVGRRADDDRPKEVEREHHAPVTPEQMYQTLDRLAELNLPIQLTEISAKTPDPQARADALEALYRVGYSHPKVDLILLWGFWDRRHWLGKDATIVNGDWSLNPAGERLTRMLLEEWRTKLDSRTDAESKLRFRGFHGTYRITSADGSLSGTFDLSPGQAEAAVQLQPVE